MLLSEVARVGLSKQNLWLGVSANDDSGGGCIIWYYTLVSASSKNTTPEETLIFIKKRYQLVTIQKIVASDLCTKLRCL